MFKIIRRNDVNDKFFGFVEVDIEVPDELYNKFRVIEVKGDGDAKGAKPGNVYYLEKGTSLSELVKSLNAFGVSPEDLISIFQTLKRDGALIGEIELI